MHESLNTFSGNNQSLTGTIGSGGGNCSATAAFPDPAVDLYYPRPGSPGVDQGTDAFIHEGIDGLIRPHGAAFDIGFDEGVPWTASLPSVLM